MGKHVGSDDKQQQQQQPGGCMWGIVHVLGYHNWHSNVRKMIHHTRYQTHEDLDDAHHWNIYENDSEKLLGQQQISLHHTTKRSRATKKRSLRARIKAMIAHENNNTVKPKPNLQRTYSIHHLESVDDALTSKITTNHPIIFLPDINASSQSFETKASGTDLEPSREEPDVYEIFKVDKELLLKHLDRTTFTKSRSFPVPDLATGRKLKPVKLETRHKEVWPSPRENRIDGTRKLRSSSLNESLDKYARLLEFNTSGKYSNFNSSRSLKLTSEYGIAPLYFTRMHSLSYVDSYYSDDLNLEALVDNPSGCASLVTAKNTTSTQIKEDSEILRSHKRVGSSEIHDQPFVLDEYHVVEPQIHEGSEHGVDELSCSNMEASKIIENDGISVKIAYSDLEYVRNLVEQSGIAVDASEIAWHSSDQLLGPQLFEEVEARWPHELTGCPDFYGCWHHQMLFDLVNQVLLEVYDLSLPYYPKPLSSSCHVRPFPVGDHIVEEVCRSVGMLVDMKDVEKESLDGIVGRDLYHNHSWMNLQLESEFVGLDIEDMIFDELMQEVVFS